MLVVVKEDVVSGANSHAGMFGDEEASMLLMDREVSPQTFLEKVHFTMNSLFRIRKCAHLQLN